MVRISKQAGNGMTRRGLLQGAAVGGVGIAGASLLPAPTASAVGASNGFVFPGVDVVIDGSHATTDVTLLVREYLARKSEADPDGTMTFFSRNPVTYIDAVLGWSWYDWDSLRTALGQFMPNWPKEGKSYPTRILGNSTGAMVFFTDTAGLFGSSEIRAVGVINFSDRRITRQIDYWDGRHFGISDTAKLRVPTDKFPADFRESTVGETAAQTMKNVSYKLARALRNGDGAGAADLFAPGAVFEDVPAHVQIVGPRSIGSYLTGTASLLPYSGQGTAVRHIVGSATGGGYEWTAADGSASRGVIALELDSWGKITRLTAMWDGSQADDSMLVSLSQKAIER
ncbi:nuclear transport factor 2 family protein [Streptomyces sp. NBC_01373]|uniref:nuclear transport factor 2 family protein n=1 Tax=Streptomyces sp. NBC_01373 TaxID=2903843 RepID=UPI0022594494|nr:hypothetical protein [Streptomyces sp. NBC_01373]MCX4706785.1 hypothetical protein [Streptomyces sp. NBC_01373]